MNIRELFLELTTRTYPSGTEDEMFHLLPKGTIRDFSGNYFIEIGDSQTIFTSHRYARRYRSIYQSSFQWRSYSL